MLSEKQKSRIERLIDAKGEDFEEGDAIAIVRRALFEMNNLELAFYALLHPDIREAAGVDDYEFNDSRFSFLEDSVKSLSPRQKAELVLALLVMARETDEKDDERQVLITAHDLIFMRFNLPKKSDAEYQRRLLESGIYNYRWEEGDVVEDIETLEGCARVLIELAGRV